jgi:hypothetical protein
MDNYHRAPAQFLRASVAAPTTSMVHELYPHQVQTQADAEAQADKLAGAADAFEMVNGRLVQVRDPITGLPLPGAS